MSAPQKRGHRSPSLPPALVQAAIHPQITTFQGFMAKQVKNARNSLETSLRLTAPEDLEGTVTALGRVADGPARLSLAWLAQMNGIRTEKV